MWVLVVAICTISFGQGYLFQRLVVTDPDSTAAAVGQWILWLVIGLVVIVPFTETYLLRRMIREKLETEGLLRKPAGPIGAD